MLRHEVKICRDVMAHTVPITLLSTTKLHSSKVKDHEVNKIMSFCYTMWYKPLQMRSMSVYGESGWSVDGGQSQG